MIKKILIIHRVSGVPLLVMDSEGSELASSDVLLSGMMKALEGLAKELGIGDFSSFETSDAVFLVASLRNVLVVLLLDHEGDVEQYKKFAIEVAWSFEATYRLENWDGNVDRFSEFKSRIISILERTAWRKMPGKDGELMEGVEGYVVYDRVSHRLWYELNVKMDVVALINSWEAALGELVEANDENFTYVFAKSKHTPFGAICILNKSLPEREVKRFSKLSVFISENAEKSILLPEGTLKAAKLLFGEDAVKEAREYEGKMLLEALSYHENPLAFLDLIRRMSVRGVVSLK